MVRKVLRKPEVKAATGWPDSTLYWHIAEGRFPKGHKLVPGGRAVGWYEDEVEAFQKGTWNPSPIAA